MIDLDKVQEMWVKDSKIDMDNLHTESTNIPSLHAKYFELYNTSFFSERKQSNRRKIFDTKDTNTSVVKLILMYT